MAPNPQALFAANRTGSTPVVTLVLIQALKMAYPGLLRFNRFNGDMMVLGEADWRPGVTKHRRCDDSEILDMTIYAQEMGYLKATSEKMLEAVRYISFQDAYDPAVDWLLGLPEWDRLERLKRFAELYLGHPVSTFPRVFVVWFLQMIHRILAPGPQCKADLVPILWGTQGFYKSTLGLALCPDFEWFTGELPEDLGHKDTRAHLRGKLIVELTEMRQFARGRADTTKQFLSTTVDRYRPSYGRLEIEWARRCVFYASTNHVDMLQDETGNRRFVPVEVRSKIPIEQVVADRDQLFAEALHLYNTQQGATWLSDEEQASLEGLRDEHMVRGVYDDVVADFVHEDCLDGTEVGTHLFPFRLVMSYVLGDGEARSVHDRESRRIQQCLTRMGFRSYVVRSEEGPVQRLWGRNTAVTATVTQQSTTVTMADMTDNFIRRCRM